MENRDAGGGGGGAGTKKGHLEMANVESEARVDLNRVVLVQGCLMERKKKTPFLSVKLPWRCGRSFFFLRTKFNFCSR